jgi:hypothetical protein
MTLNLIPQKIISHLKKIQTDLSDYNDSIDLFGNDIEPDPAEKNQPSE